MFDDPGALDAFARSALGADLAEDAAADIGAAGLLRDQPAQALALLERARASAPAHPAPLIALYRFHFYGHRLVQARAAGEQALALARAALDAHFGPRFGQTPFSGEAVRFDAAVRFYLFTLKGLAYLNLRLGAPEAARAQLDQLRGLDPDDCVGGALLSHVLARHEQLAAWDEDEDGENGDSAEFFGHAHPARGWAGDASALSAASALAKAARRDDERAAP